MSRPHSLDRHLTCPICLKTFETRQGVKAHQKRKGHQTHRFVAEEWAKYADAKPA